MLTRLMAGFALASSLLMASAVTAPAAKAADLMNTGLSLKFAIGGALPHASKNAYLTGTLDGPGDGISPQVGTTSRLPMADRARFYFEPRPQIMLGGSYPLGNWGGAKVSLDGLIGAGTNAEFRETQAMMGIAGFRFIF
ncbi:hypothetical protein IAI18_18190 [Acetobacteraceae bacterium H6797]|nr:hypothetical protein [Acetobacteraceae bacterium H6797]